ncbi:MAG: flagellar hook-length control protein FliK [Noviherbaspirillum sp.]
MTTPSPLSSLSPLPPASGPGPAAQQASARPGEAGQEPFDRALAREVASPAGAASGPASAPASGPAPAPGNASAAPEKAGADSASADQGEESVVAAGSADAAALTQFLAMAAQAVQTMPAARSPGKAQPAADSLLPAGEDGAAGNIRLTAADGDGAAAAQPGQAAQAALQGLPEGAAPGALAASAASPDSLAPGAADPSLHAFSALAPARAGQAHAAAPDALPQAPRLAPQVGAPGWDQALGQRVAWMAGNGQHSASLILNPPELGPLQVVLNVADSQATATFFSAQPEVRQALEAAMPRLRDMLDAAGIELGQASVSDGGGQQAAMGDGGSGGRHGRTGGGAGAGMEAVPGGNTVATRVREGLVNTFA